MTEYAEGECATCGAIRPKNEMKVVSVQRVTGKSYGSGSSHTTGNSNSSSYGGDRSTRFRSGSSNSNRTRSSTRTHMAKDRVWVCKGCRAPKSDMSPTQRSFMWGAIAVAAFFGFQFVGGDGSGQSQSQPEVGPSVDDQDGLPFDGHSDGGPSDEDSGSLTEASPPPRPDDVEADAAPAQPDTADRAKTSAPVASSEIDRAMRQAFQTGEPTRWRDGDQKGYAVPSSIEPSSGCRSVYYSIDEREGWHSAAETICP